MTTAQTDAISDEISLIEFAARIRAFGNLVWREKRTVLRYAVIAGLAGSFVAFGSEEEFTAKTRLIPYKMGVGASSLSGLAGLAGIRIPAGATEQIITADLYPEVAKSQDFRLEVAETPLVFSSVNRRATTVEYFRDLHKTSPFEIVLDYTLGLPRKVLSAVRNESQSGQSSAEGSDTTSMLAQYNPEYLALVNVLDRRLTVSVEKKTSIVTITGRMPDSYAAADLVRVAAVRLTERIANYESHKAGQQFEFVEEQYNRVKARFERAQRELAIFADQNRVLTSATSKIRQERLQREHDLSFEVYQQLSRELEQARIKLNQEIPVFTTLERVVVPNQRSAPSRARILLVSAFLGILVGVGTIIVRKLMTPALSNQGI
jgi:uncharacterized protein involved in exopolysaccharide biosynthesis